MARPKLKSPLEYDPDVSPETAGDRRSGRARDELQLVEISVPLADEVHDPVPHNLEVQLRSQESKAGMARLRDGLIGAGERLAGGGRVVESNADAIRWLLEQLAAN